MKLNRMNLAVWSLAALALVLAACGGGKSGGTPAPASSLSITTTDVAGTATTYTADGSNSIIAANKDPVTGKTIVQVCSDLDKDNDCSVLILMTIDGTTAQTYSMSSPDSLTQIVYHDDEAETGVLSHYLSSDGQIVVTESGSSAGESVKGTFSSTLACNAGCSGNIVLSGTFSVVLSQ
jgi:hypothetical protein